LALMALATRPRNGDVAATLVALPQNFTAPSALTAPSAGPSSGVQGRQDHARVVVAARRRTAKWRTVRTLFRAPVVPRASSSSRARSAICKRSAGLDRLPFRAHLARKSCLAPDTAHARASQGPRAPVFHGVEARSW
jgi:hypothetical protein